MKKYVCKYKKYPKKAVTVSTSELTKCLTKNEFNKLASMEKYFLSQDLTK